MCSSDLSFEPGEVSFEKAHEIGKQLAEAVTKGQHEYVLTAALADLGPEGFEMQRQDLLHAPGAHEGGQGRRRERVAGEVGDAPE